MAVGRMTVISIIGILALHSLSSNRHQTNASSHWIRVRDGWLLAMTQTGNKLCVVEFDRKSQHDSMMLLDQNGKLVRHLPRLTGDMKGTADGLIYASDGGRITVMNQSGKILRRMGSLGKRTDQFGKEVDEEGDPWYGPQYIAVGTSDDVLGYDDTSHAIKHFSAKGKFLSSYGQAILRHYQVNGLAADKSGNAYVSAMKTDGSNATVLCLSPKGVLLRTYGSKGDGVGKFAGPKQWEGPYYGPGEITVGVDGKVYAQDSSTNEVEVFEPSGKALKTIPRYGTEYMISGLAVTANGTLYMGGSDGVLVYRGS